MKSPTIFVLAMALSGVAFDAQAQQAPMQSTSPAQSDPAASQPMAPGAMATPAAPVTPKVGDPVYDTEGVIAGSVESVANQQVVLTTDKGRAAIATSYLSMGSKGLMINLSKAQLDAAIVAAKNGQRPQ